MHKSYIQSLYLLTKRHITCTNTMQDFQHVCTPTLIVHSVSQYSNGGSSLSCVLPSLQHLHTVFSFISHPSRLTTLHLSLGKAQMPGKLPPVSRKQKIVRDSNNDGIDWGILALQERLQQASVVRGVHYTSRVLLNYVR